MPDRIAFLRFKAPSRLFCSPPMIAAVAALVLSFGMSVSQASAEPVDVDSEIPAPAGDRMADQIGGDWIRVQARPSEQLEADQVTNCERQRKMVDEVARTQLGRQLSRTSADLETIQRILDEKRLGSNPEDMLQALGVVLGDVLVAQAGYRWIRFEDERGRSRALRSRDKQTVAFPVTAISRIVEMNHRPDVAGIYSQLAAMGRAESGSKNR